MIEPDAKMNRRECFEVTRTVVAGVTPVASKATEIYRDCQRRWRIAERFSPPDWSIVDLWVAKYLLSLGLPATQVEDIVRLGSPHFPRQHGDPNDYLRRTLARAAFPFPSQEGTV
jgi:hypothetical protein